MHFFPLKERNQQLQKSDSKEIIFQIKPLSIMKKQKSPIAKIQNDRHAERRIAKSQSLAFEERPYKSTVLIPKLQSNCEYLLSCYLAS